MGEFLAIERLRSERDKGVEEWLDGSLLKGIGEKNAEASDLGLQLNMQLLAEE